MIFDRCWLGLGGKRRGILRKATALVSNAPEILQQMLGLRCPGRHRRVRVDGRDGRDAQIWPWKMAERSVQGAVVLRRRLRRSSPKVHGLDGDASVFPAVAPGRRGRDQT